MCSYIKSHCICGIYKIFVNYTSVKLGNKKYKCQVQWCLPTVPATRKAKEEYHLNPDIRGQSGQYSQTTSFKKKFAMIQKILIVLLINLT